MTFPTFLRKAFTVAAIGASLVYPMYAQDKQGHFEFGLGARVQQELTATLGNKGEQALMNPARRFKISEIQYLRLADTLTAYDEMRERKSSRISFKPDMQLTLYNVVNRPAFYVSDARRLPVFFKPVKFE